MQTASKKSVVESPSSQPTTTTEPDTVSASVPDKLAALHVTPETGLTHAEVDSHRAAVRAVAGAGFAMAVTTVMGRLHGLVTVSQR